MIYLLTGEDHVALDPAVQKIVSSLGLTPEKLAGDELSESGLVDALTATTLFSDKRLVIIRRLSENKTLWNKLPDYLSRLSDDITLVLIEPTVDKRTTVFKTLKSVSEYQDFPLARADDSAKFRLLDVALAGDKQQIQMMIDDMKLSEDPYLMFGLIASQVFNLTAVWSAEAGDDLAKDLGLKPYTLSRLKTQAKKLNTSDVKKLTRLVADADWDIKNSRGEPWLVIEKLLYQI